MSPGNLAFPRGLAARTAGLALGPALACLVARGEARGSVAMLAVRAVKLERCMAAMLGTVLLALSA